MTFFKMYAFHLRRYGSQSYFFFLVLTSTVGLLLLRYLVQYATGSLLTGQDVMTAAFFGMWNSAVTAAGILHFQRSQGVLVYLVNASKNAWQALAALVSSSATFGLIALPIAILTTFVLNGGSWPAISSQSIALLFFFWLSALPITYVLASLFLLSQNAFVYESLFVTPLLILSGLFGQNLLQGSILGKVAPLIPVRWPIQLLKNGNGWSFSGFLFWFIVMIFWLGQPCPSNRFETDSGDRRTGGALNVG
ncbi:hypothetical protein [Fructobacillus papyrifericola]|uniref:ABC transporter permease n=1 Tax=Fructobacillus papyrifericola TaxID=2713172 RepID=A0ABS5QTN4_9LACO|nr:hypothetical protein [Fructobacillus papyrifericola]MBS9335684.1 hypothetical protein [Fructobacillus papyrifericola]